MKFNKVQTNRDRRIKPRYRINVRVKIQARLIGSRHNFEFISEDISESGLLIRHTGNDRVGFNEQSILEVWLYPPQGVAIFFYAKFVRFSKETQLLAIRIVDMERQDFEGYRDFILAHAREEIP